MNYFMTTDYFWLRLMVSLTARKVPDAIIRFLAGISYSLFFSPRYFISFIERFARDLNFPISSFINGIEKIAGDFANGTLYSRADTLSCAIFHAFIFINGSDEEDS